jgi:carbonic anhydrase/acetyltransferase-like protein (isoleucine patch superfamily)
MIEPTAPSLPPDVLHADARTLSLIDSISLTTRSDVQTRPGMSLRDRLGYGWNAARTRLLWGRRLHALGPRCVLGRKQMVRNPGAVSIGSRVTICDGFVFADLAPGSGKCPKIKIGSGVIILFRFQCNSAESVTIGDNVLIASNVLITDSDHIVEPGGLPVTRNPNFITRPVVIESNCWIGQNAVILKGVTVGRDSIVGANSVVSRDVAPCSIVGGNPARLIKRNEPNAKEKFECAAVNMPAEERPAWKQ